MVINISAKCYHWMLGQGWSPYSRAHEPGCQPRICGSGNTARSGKLVGWSGLLVAGGLVPHFHLRGIKAWKWVEGGCSEKGWPPPGVFLMLS